MTNPDRPHPSFLPHDHETAFLHPAQKDFHLIPEDPALYQFLSGTLETHTGKNTLGITFPLANCVTLVYPRIQGPENVTLVGQLRALADLYQSQDPQVNIPMYNFFDRLHLIAASKNPNVAVASFATYGDNLYLSWPSSLGISIRQPGQSPQDLDAFTPITHTHQKPTNPLEAFQFHNRIAKGTEVFVTEPGSDRVLTKFHFKGAPLIHDDPDMLITAIKSMGEHRHRTATTGDTYTRDGLLQVLNHLIDGSRFSIQVHNQSSFGGLRNSFQEISKYPQKLERLRKLVQAELDN